MTMRRDVLLTWLLIPGAMLHELTHILVAIQYAGYSVTYERPNATIPIVGVRLKLHWNAEAPLWAVLAGQVAPMVVGLWLAPVVAYGLLWALSAGLPVGVAGWVVLNWFIFVAASADDIGEARRAFKEWPIVTPS